MYSVQWNSVNLVNETIQLQCSPQLNSAQFYFKPMYTVQSNPIKLGAVYNFTFKPMYTVQSNPIKLGAVYNFTIECIEDYKLI